MKDIRSRLEYFLAKIAGRDVNIGDLTPPVASDTTEELMLEIADRLDNSGGGMPDPTQYDDGTVLVKVGDEWKPQEGYGYDEREVLVDEDIVIENKQGQIDPVELIVGEKYKVIWDSQVYEDVEASEDTDGNVKLALPPIVRVTIYNTGLLSVYQDGEHHLSIVKSDVHTFDQKYLPAAQTDVFTIKFETYEEDDYIADKPVEEVLEAIAAGKYICGVYSSSSGVHACYTLSSCVNQRIILSNYVVGPVDDGDRLYIEFIECSAGGDDQYIWTASSYFFG